jgi:hypothetical protein
MNTPVSTPLMESCADAIALDRDIGVSLRLASERIATRIDTIVVAVTTSSCPRCGAQLLRSGTFDLGGFSALTPHELTRALERIREDHLRRCPGPAAGRAWIWDPKFRPVVWRQVRVVDGAHYV